MFFDNPPSTSATTVGCIKFSILLKCILVAVTDVVSKQEAVDRDHSKFHPFHRSLGHILKSLTFCLLLLNFQIMERQVVQVVPLDLVLPGLQV